MPSDSTPTNFLRTARSASLRIADDPSRSHPPAAHRHAIGASAPYHARHPAAAIVAVLGSGRGAVHADSSARAGHGFQSKGMRSCGHSSWRRSVRPVGVALEARACPPPTSRGGLFGASVRRKAHPASPAPREDDQAFLIRVRASSLQASSIVPAARAEIAGRRRLEYQSWCWLFAETANRRSPSARTAQPFARGADGVATRGRPFPPWACPPRAVAR